MDTSNNKLKSFAVRLLRLLPLACMCAAIIWFLSSGRNLSIEDVLSYTPEEPLLAAAFLWLAFAAKSMSLLFPVLILFAVGGLLFPLPVALLVNTVGIAVTLTLPYLIGRGAGDDLTEKLMVKYPKLAEVRAMRRRNSFFFAFAIRVIGVLPCDVVSLYLGNTRLPYLQYIAGGVLGFMPDLVCATVVGMKISDTSSPWFWISIALNIFICAASCLGYRAYRKKLKKESG